METKNEQNTLDKNLDKKKKAFLVSLAFVLLAYLVLIFFIFSCFGKIREASNDLLSIKNEIAVLNSQADDVENFKRNYSNYLPTLQKIDQVFVDPQNPLSFIEFLEKSASDANVNLEISPLLFSDEGGSKILNLQLSCTGSLAGKLSFLKTLEEGPYLLSVQDLAVSNPEAIKTDKGGLAEKPRATFSIKVLTQQ